MTPEVIRRIKDLLAADLDHQHDIGAIVGVNQGRISETKNGHYDWKLNIQDRQQSLF